MQQPDSNEVMRLALKLTDVNGPDYVRGMLKKFYGATSILEVKPSDYVRLCRDMRIRIERGSNYG